MAYKIDISIEQMNVSEEISHLAQIEEYRKIFNKLIKAEEQAKKDRDHAKANQDAQTYLEVDLELDRIVQYWMPFLTAQEKATKLVEADYKLADETGRLEPENSDYEPDPIVSLFLIILEATIDEWANEVQERVLAAAAGEMPLDVFLEEVLQLTPGLRMLQDFRDALIPTDDNGELAKIIRDPVKRPIEIIQNIRDGIISPDDNGELAKIVREPIKRPVKVVKKVIKKFLGIG